MVPPPGAYSLIVHMALTFKYYLPQISGQNNTGGEKSKYTTSEGGSATDGTAEQGRTGEPERKKQLERRWMSLELTELPQLRSPQGCSESPSCSLLLSSRHVNNHSDPHYLPRLHVLLMIVHLLSSFSLQMSDHPPKHRPRPAHPDAPCVF